MTYTQCIFLQLTQSYLLGRAMEEHLSSKRGTLSSPWLTALGDEEGNICRCKVLALKNLHSLPYYPPKIMNYPFGGGGGAYSPLRFISSASGTSQALKVDTVLCLQLPSSLGELGWPRKALLSFKEPDRL